MEKLSEENLPDFQNWLKQRVVVTCPKCVGEFYFPETTVKFVEDDSSVYGSPFRFDQSPLKIACGTPKCGTIILLDPRELNDRYIKYRADNS